VLHSTIKFTRSKFQNICACVLGDLTQDFVDGLEIEDEFGTCGIIPVHFRDLPVNCHLCQERGHLPQTCPLKEARAFNSQESSKKSPIPKVPEYASSPSVTGTKGKEPAASNQSAEFTEVSYCKGKGSTKVHSPKVNSQPINPEAVKSAVNRNIFEALDQTQEFDFMKEEQLGQEFKDNAAKAAPMVNQDAASESSDPDYLASQSPRESTTFTTKFSTKAAEEELAQLQEAMRVPPLLLHQRLTRLSTLPPAQASRILNLPQEFKQWIKNAPLQLVKSDHEL
jgi:hypothetical protein